MKIISLIPCAINDVTTRAGVRALVTFNCLLYILLFPYFSLVNCAANVAERVVAHLHRPQPLVSLRVVATDHVDVFVVDVYGSVSEPADVHGGVFLERVHAHVDLVDLVAGVVDVVAAGDEQPPVLLGVHERRVLSQLLALYRHTPNRLLERLVEIHSLTLHLNQLVLVRLYCQLYFHVLLELVPAVDLVEDEFIVECVGDDLFELFAHLLELLALVLDLLGRVDDRHELAQLNLPLHRLVLRRQLRRLPLQYLTLLHQLQGYLLLLHVFLLLSLHELVLQSQQLLVDEVEELRGGFLLLVLQVSSQLDLLIDVGDRVINEVKVVLDNLQLHLRVGLQHSDLVVGSAVRLETIHAQLHAVALTKVYVVFLVVRTNIIVACSSPCAEYGASEFGVRAHP